MFYDTIIVGDTMKYLVNINELDEVIKRLTDEIEEISEQINHLIIIQNELVWEGLAKDAFNNKYNDYLDNLKKIFSRLVKLLLFLKSYHNNFDDEFTRIQALYNRTMYDEVIKWG